MTSQPTNALNLDSVQQQNFIKYYNSLPEKPPTTVRIFDRNDYYSVHGIDATTTAKEVFSSLSKIKVMGLQPNTLDYLTLSKGNFEISIKKLLLVKRYRVEIYVADGSIKSNDWELKYKGSPGYLSQLEEILGEALANNDDATVPCLLAVNIKTDPLTKGRLLGVACVNTSEYQLSVTEFTDDDLLTELETVTVQIAPTECLIPQIENEEYKALKKVMERANVTVTKCKKSEFLTEGLNQDLNRLLKFKTNQPADCNAFPETRMNVAMSSLAAAVKYSELLSDETNFGRYRLSSMQIECFLQVDAAALTALNVFPEVGDTSRSPSRSLYGLLDRCRTAHGKRLLAQWLRQPLRDINLINERLDVVQVLTDSSALRLQLHDDHLRRMPDLQALATKLCRRKATLQHCFRVYQAINRLPSLLQCLAEANNATVHSSFAEPISELNEDLDKYKEMIEATVDMDAVDKGEYLVKPSFDEQLEALGERLKELQSDAERELSKAASDLGLDAGRTIKLDTNAQCGFHFRVTLKEEHCIRGNKKYIIIDAVKGGVRFKTISLESITEDYTQTKTNYEKEQDKVVSEIVNIAAGYTECLFCLSHIVARLDVLVSFAIATTSAPAPYCRPEIVESLDEFILEEARHPCLELQDGISYIPNDVIFKREECVMHIITGPNMGGKSTWMRSAGACAVLAHAGCPVPAVRAKLPKLRRVAARVGASDKEAKAHSTFMVEMIECAAILRTATPDSLVLVDELGRGTSTYEGCGIAWAIAEALATQSQSFTLFATHYHELTRLPLTVARVRNVHVQARVDCDRLVLLHRVEDGPAPSSLGLHVAALAGLPQSVIQFAEEKKSELETNLFDAENPDKVEESNEGKKIIAEFLKKCKLIHEETSCDDELMSKIELLSVQLRDNPNQYVQALVR